MAKVYDPIMCMMVEQKTNDAKPMREMNVNELRELAVSLGADRNKLYGTSKEALIIIIDKLKRQKSKDQRTCDADIVFKNIYDSFASSLKAAEKMSPKDANAYIRKIMIGYLNSMNDRFNTISNEHHNYYDKIQSEGQKALEKAYERYMREGKT